MAFGKFRAYSNVLCGCGNPAIVEHLAHGRHHPYLLFLSATHIPCHLSSLKLSLSTRNIPLTDSNACQKMLAFVFQFYLAYGASQIRPTDQLNQWSDGSSSSSRNQVRPKWPNDKQNSRGNSTLKIHSNKIPKTFIWHCWLKNFIGILSQESWEIFVVGSDEFASRWGPGIWKWKNGKWKKEILNHQSNLPNMAEAHHKIIFR